MIGAIIAKRKVCSAFASLNQRDISGFLADWREDAIWIYPGSLSISGRIEGKKAIEQWFQKFLERFPKLNFTLKNVCVQNIFALGGTNVVTVEWDIALTNQEGKDFQNSGVTIIKLEKGKAILVQVYIFDHQVSERAWGEEKS